MGGKDRREEKEIAYHRRQRGFSSRSAPFGLPRIDKRGITICIPAYNEEATIKQVVIDAELALKQASVPGEILVIDDGSADRTWEILCNIQKTVPILEIRRHNINRGIALTFTELYRWASKELVFLNSADGQWQMSTLLELLPMAGSA